MKIEKLDFNKLKITLFVEELQMYNINLKTLAPDSPELHTFLCEMMKMVNLRTNFHPFEGQVVIEATPSADALVLMLSKIESRFPEKKRIRAVRKKTREYICRFDSFDALGDFFKTGCDFGKASLYRMKNAYFLVCKTDKSVPLLKEFSSVKRSGGAGERYLSEHGEFVADGEKLANIADFFKGDKNNV